MREVVRDKEHEGRHTIFSAPSKDAVQRLCPAGCHLMKLMLFLCASLIPVCML